MQRTLLMLGLAVAALPASAQVLDCDVLIEKIAKRLDGKKVTDYGLTAVPVAENHPGKEVGRCNRGSMKVMLERGKEAGKADKE